MTVIIFLLILIAIGSMLACPYIARKRGSNVVFWGVMDALFGPFAIPFVLMSKPKK